MAFIKKIKIGILGANRGMDYAKHFMLLGCDIVAVCENRTEAMDAAKAKLGDMVSYYADFDDFIEHDIDAVFVANYFPEHAPYAIRCMEKGIHVLSECMANGTMAEGVALLRAFEKSNVVYMLAENYPHMKSNREMKRLVQGGTLGKIIYAESEYNHPFNPNDGACTKRLFHGMNHWRFYNPRTYYITHSLGPCMYITGANPTRVTAMATFAPREDTSGGASYVGDRAAILMTQNDDGSIFHFTGCSAFGAQHNSCRVCGTDGQAENLRGMGEQIMLRYNQWAIPEGREENNLYEPRWDDPDEAFIRQSGHGGSDYVTARIFINCIREKKQPEHPFDIYSAVNMASVAILGHRSMLEGGKPYDIPDMHLEENRQKYAHDRLTPFWGSDGTPPSLPCCSVQDFRPTEKQRKAWKEFDSNR